MHKPIKPKQLFVEGRDAEEFFGALLRKMDLVNEIQIRNFGGVSELSGFLRSILDAPGAQDSLRSEIASLGIIRDAEAGSPEDVFKSVCGALNKAKLTEPDQIEEFQRIPKKSLSSIRLRTK